MKNKIILISLIILTILSSCIFIATYIQYIKDSSKLDKNSNTETNYSENIPENETVIKIDEDSSIRLVQKYDENMFKGKKSLVFFWASWCSHCREEYEVIQTAITDYQNRGYNIYLISHDYKTEELADFMKNNDLNYEVYLDKQRIIRANFDPEASSVPLTYIIDENARLIDSHSGIISLDELNALINKNM